MVTTEAPSLDQLENHSEFVRATGLKLTETTSTLVRGWIDLDASHHQPWGIVHGGVYSSAIESAASIGASLAVMDQGLVAVGVNNNTNFVSTLSEGRVEVVARPLVQGRTQQLWQVDVTRQDGRLAATGQVRLQNVAPR